MERVVLPVDEGRDSLLEPAELAVEIGARLFRVAYSGVVVVRDGPNRLARVVGAKAPGRK